MNDVNVYVVVRRGEESLTELEAFSCSISPSAGLPNVHKAESLPIKFWEEE